jgi:hypothetical protein
LQKKGTKNSACAAGGGNEFIPFMNHAAKAPLPTARPHRRNKKAGLPAAQLLSGLPGAFPVAREEKKVISGVRRRVRSRFARDSLLSPSGRFVSRKCHETKFLSILPSAGEYHFFNVFGMIAA